VKTSSNADWQARKNAAVARGQGNLAPVFIERAENAEMWDVEGKRYVDFGTGIAVVPALLFVQPVIPILK